MDEVYSFFKEDHLEDIKSMKSIVTRICQQTVECCYFLRDYSKTKNFCESTNDKVVIIELTQFFFAGIRLGKNLMSDTDNTVKGYNAVFDGLMQQFRHTAARDTVVVVHRVLEGVQGFGKCFM